MAKTSAFILKQHKGGDNRSTHPPFFQYARAFSDLLIVGKYWTGKVCQTLSKKRPEEIKALLEVGFEYVVEK